MVECCYLSKYDKVELVTVQKNLPGPTNGGLILFDKTAYRKNIFPDARVSCARFRGSDKVEFNVIPCDQCNH